MNKYKIELIIESDGEMDSDPSFITEVFAQSETEAFAAGKDALIKEHPEINFMKAWCWHIEVLDRAIS